MAHEGRKEPGNCEKAHEGQREPGSCETVQDGILAKLKPGIGFCFWFLETLYKYKYY